MRRIITFLLLILLSRFVFSQNIPNAGFEDWIVAGNHNDPVSWDTPNPETSAVPIVGMVTVSKSSDSYSGSWSARLESKSLLTFVVPGLMTLGSFSLNNFNPVLSGGVPFTQRPSALKGYYKFSPAGGDTCLIGVMLYNYIPGIGRDTIALGGLMNTVLISDWTEFTVPLEYYSAEQPDTMNIIILSTASVNPHTGNVLFIDGLSWDFTSSSKGTQPDQSMLWYDADEKRIGFRAGTNFCSDGLFNIYNQAGQLIRSKTLHPEDDAFFSVASLTRGLYLAEVINRQGRISLKFIKTD